MGSKASVWPDRATFAVGTRVTSRPPHRSVRAQFGLYGAFFVKGASRHFGRPLHSILLFDPRRELLPSRPQISIAVARSGGQGRRFFSAAEGLSLADAST